MYYIGCSLGIRTNVFLTISFQKVVKNRKVIQGYVKSEYGELKTYANLEAEIKPFYSFWQLFGPWALGIRKVRIKFVRIANH